jgi:hypothetical protein
MGGGLSQIGAAADAVAEGGSVDPQTNDRTAPPAPPLEHRHTTSRGDAVAATSSGGVRLLLARRPPAPVQSTTWETTVRWIVAGGVTVLLAWLTYARDGWIPLLSACDLGVHEFGHLLTIWAPALLCSLAGSALQVAAPLALGGYFWWRRDSLAAILMVAWAAENLHNVSVYVADAQRMVLPLFGDDGSGAGHDWHNILGGLGWLPATDQVALVVKTGSAVLFVVAVGLAAWGFARAHRA